MRRLLFVLAGLPACWPAASDTARDVGRLADDVIPRVEATVGLTFRTPPTIDVRTRAQVHQYLIGRLDAEYPAERLERVAMAYRRFGLIADTVDLRELLLVVLAEQVVGYFDPDSATLYVVDGTDPAQLRFVLAHELVHALQHQYLPLDSILGSQGQNDRKMAAQAVLEGQATLAMLTAMLPDDQIRQLGNFWRDLRDNFRREQERMPLFAAAPLILREGLLFPYLAGADFMRWFGSVYPDTQPYGPRLPTSTEQILHPERFRSGDAPTALALAPAPRVGALLYEDTWGEFETRIVLQELTGSESLGTAGALGWDGDRFAIYAASPSDALVWWSVWDTPAAAEKFATMLERNWGKRVADGRRWRVERVLIEERPGVRLVDAPADWAGWADVPGVEVR